MNFYTVHCPICVTPFPTHVWIKDRLLDLINQADSESLEPKEMDESVAIYHGLPEHDDIARLDWSNSNDMTRPWVEYYYPYFKYLVTNIATKLSFPGFRLFAMWFQQYLNNGQHNWHTHSNNYTGVYYLEFPDGAPPTEISQNGEIVPLNIKEGDFVIFPAFLYHRAPPVKNVDRKTIISFNLDFTGIGNYVN